MAIEDSGIVIGNKTVWYDTNLPGQNTFEHVQVPGTDPDRQNVGFYVPKGPVGNESQYFDAMVADDPLNEAFNKRNRRQGSWPLGGVAPHKGDIIKFNQASGSSFSEIHNYEFVAGSQITYQVAGPRPNSFGVTLGGPQSGFSLPSVPNAARPLMRDFVVRVVAKHSNANTSNNQVIVSYGFDALNSAGFGVLLNQNFIDFRISDGTDTHVSRRLHNGNFWQENVWYDIFFIVDRDEDSVKVEFRTEASPQTFQSVLMTHQSGVAVSALGSIAPTQSFSIGRVTDNLGSEPLWFSADLFRIEYGLW